VSTGETETVHPSTWEPEAGIGFRHEALLYAGRHDLVETLVPYLREGLSAGETTVALLEADKIALLREALGPDADGVHFTDTADVGRNPARYIPRWREFVDRHLKTDRPVRAVEESDLSGRGSAELDEYFVHEALLNVAFADDPPWSLLCSYDVDTLTRDVVDECRNHHPFVNADGGQGPNPGYRPAATSAGRDRPLFPPPADARRIEFGRGTAPRHIRDMVFDHVVGSGLDTVAAEQLVLAVNELVSNTITHGGGAGTVRLWRDGVVAVCEVSDGGRLDAPPLLGRRQPMVEQVGGRGLWLVNQLCDLVQIRAVTGGTTVRVHMWPTAAA
jgi:anti-sigma regulatory factor (Ser/Thr protein kinase)